jgi:hypothetical protein
VTKTEQLTVLIAKTLVYFLVLTNYYIILYYKSNQLLNLPNLLPSFSKLVTKAAKTTRDFVAIFLVVTHNALKNLVTLATLLTAVSY